MFVMYVMTVGSVLCFYTAICFLRAFTNFACYCTVNIMSFVHCFLNASNVMIHYVCVVYGEGDIHNSVCPPQCMKHLDSFLFMCVEC